MEVVGITYLDIMLDLDLIGPRKLQELLEKFHEVD
jgi:hypothetical protein